MRLGESWLQHRLENVSGCCGHQKEELERSGAIMEKEAGREREAQ